MILPHKGIEPCSRTVVLMANILSGIMHGAASLGDIGCGRLPEQMRIYPPLHMCSVPDPMLLSVRCKPMFPVMVIDL